MSYPSEETIRRARLTHGECKAEDSERAAWQEFPDIIVTGDVVIADEPSLMLAGEQEYP